MKAMMKLYTKKSRGISLLEVMLSLLVIAGIIFIVLRYAGPARQQTQITQYIRQINTLSDASFRWLRGQDSLKGITIPTLANAGLMPSRYITEKYNNPWRNEFYINENIYIAPNSPNALAVWSFVPSKTICEALKQRVLKFATAASCNGDAPKVNFTVIIGD